MRARLVVRWLDWAFRRLDEYDYFCSLPLADFVDAERLAQHEGKRRIKVNARWIRRERLRNRFTFDRYCRSFGVDD
jgi:hypothetical protein